MREFGGHQLHLMCRHEAYGVGGAILFARKSIFEEMNGLTEDIPLNYNDVDFCLRLRDRGYTCVVDPAIEAYHFESSTKKGTAVVEQERMFLTRADTRDPYLSKWFDSRNPWFRNRPGGSGPSAALWSLAGSARGAARSCAGASGQRQACPLYPGDRPAAQLPGRSSAICDDADLRQRSASRRRLRHP